MQQRSVFVNVVGWIFLVLSGLGVLECLVFMFIPWQEFISQVQIPANQMPHDMQVAGMQMLRAFLWIWLILGLWVVVSSIGLLLRKNWARISYIVMISLGIGLSAIYLLMGIAMLVMFNTKGFPAKQPLPPGFPAFMSAFMAIWIIFTVIFLALYIWILIKLTSEAIAREFRPPSTGLQA